MRSRSIMLLASAGLAIAHPSEALHHNHKRWHELKARDQPTETTVIVGSTVSVYELNGQQISYDELQEGLKNGTLVLDGDAPVASPQQAAAPQPPVVKHSSQAQPTTQPSPSPSPAPTPSSSSSPAPQPSTSAAPSKAPSANKAVQPAAAQNGGSNNGVSSSSSSGSGQSGYGTNSGTGLDTPYDNSVSCSDFPDQFGAIPVNYLGLGGFLAVVAPGAGSSSAGYNNLATANAGGKCQEGDFCSYACPAGYEKTQWPQTQGATGQSVGGLLCKNGKLTLTRPDVPNLCSSSMVKAKISIQNNLSQQVSVCRTDYPGTENMNIPLGLAAGASSDIACPDAATAYKWQNKDTSAQYYVNPAGLSPEQACQWGTPDNDWGNYAPLNLGVGYNNGMAWLSIFQNAPTTQAKLGFKVSIQGDINGNCVYQNGVYSGPNQGCTVSVPEGGSATFVFEDA